MRQQAIYLSLRKRTSRSTALVHTFERGLFHKSTFISGHPHLSHKSSSVSLRGPLPQECIRRPARNPLPRVRPSERPGLVTRVRRNKDLEFNCPWGRHRRDSPTKDMLAAPGASRLRGATSATVNISSSTNSSKIETLLNIISIITKHT